MRAVTSKYKDEAASAPTPAPTPTPTPTPTPAEATPESDLPSPEHKGYRQCGGTFPEYQVRAMPIVLPRCSQGEVRNGRRQRPSVGGDADAGDPPPALGIAGMAPDEPLPPRGAIYAMARRWAVNRCPTRPSRRLACHPVPPVPGPSLAPGGRRRPMAVRSAAQHGAGPAQHDGGQEGGTSALGAAGI